jgi:hypothetical protein
VWRAKRKPQLHHGFDAYQSLVEIFLDLVALTIMSSGHEACMHEGEAQLFTRSRSTEHKIRAPTWVEDRNNNNNDQAYNMILVAMLGIHSVLISYNIKGKNA